MTTWLDHHDIALVNRAMESLRKEQPAKWTRSLDRAGGDPRFALWLTLVDDLFESYPPLATDSPPSLSISRLRSEYSAGKAPITAAFAAWSTGGTHGITPTTSPITAER